MKIKTKMLLGLSSKPVLVVLLIIIGLLEVASINKLDEVTQNNYSISLLAEEVHRDVKNEAISLRNIVIFNNDELVQKELSQLQMMDGSLNLKLNLLAQMVNSKEQREIIENIKKTNRDFYVYRNKIIKFVSEGKREEAATLISERGRGLQEKFFVDITLLTDNLQTNLTTSFSNATNKIQKLIIVLSLIALISFFLSAGYMVKTVWGIAFRLSKVSAIMSRIANGKLDLGTRITMNSRDEIDDVAKAFNQMAESLEQKVHLEKSLLWNKTNITEINAELIGLHGLETLSEALLRRVVPLMEASMAGFYIKEMNDSSSETRYIRSASYAVNTDHQETFILGEGLIGQAAEEKSSILLSEVPSHYPKVKSGVGESSALNIYITPLKVEENVVAILELASFKPFSKEQESLLEELIEQVAIIFEKEMDRIRLAGVLEETQRLMEEIQVQSEELQTQQEELRIINEELEEQTKVLRASEGKLQAQQEELEEANIELKEKTRILEEQNNKYELKNNELENAKELLEEKANQLALSSKYKSEFLANMSHELRTPLNSLIILSRLLSDNIEGNLTNKQVEYSRTIYSSGNDLLSLIDDILDLSKIESGKMSIQPVDVHIPSLIDLLESRFVPIANEKGLKFSIILKNRAPHSFYTDEKRLLQVLNNLLSNAFKFTAKGEVTLEIDKNPNSKGGIQFKVIDTGIGIPDDKHGLIFEAFQQVDGTTSRKYGGTGLGLSICREISNLLGGKMNVESEEGKGSTFIFSLEEYKPQITGIHSLSEKKEVAAALDTLDVKSKIIPLQSVDQNRKLNSRVVPRDHIKRILIVDDDTKQRNALMELIGNMNVVVKTVSTGRETLEELKVNQFDILIMDLGLTDATGFEILEKIKENSEHQHLKIMIYTGRDLSSKEEMVLKQHAHTIIIKDSMAPQRLVEEIKIHLNNYTNETSPTETAEELSITPLPRLNGIKVLLVDDDVRNVYAISSFLEQYGVNITFAENGLECLQLMKGNPDFDLILMDIMMPEMDGYETIRNIRAMGDFNSLPIIALTAKAMKEDREKCIEAGASDYIVKPFNPNQLISLIQVWLYPQEGNKNEFNKN
ncbi:response regulator [Bacillus sp. FJAT-27245]|uniref:response regulator n=1 Tax=Bacillus sp. FJAT-27245 TaxID=1684144 RepID=UPI0006A7C3F3|nr:response regulator [Bacillus sp. FJAT-27245]